MLKQKQNILEEAISCWLCKWEKAAWCFCKIKIRKNKVLKNYIVKLGENDIVTLLFYSNLS